MILPNGYALLARLVNFDSSYRRISASLRVSMALTLVVNAFPSERLPAVPSTPASIFPLRFLPSRTMTTSTSVIPLD